MKTLRTWLDFKQLSLADFAVKVGAHRSQIGRIAQGKSRPRLVLALKIEKATYGAVRARHLMGITP